MFSPRALVRGNPTRAKFAAENIWKTQQKSVWQFYLPQAVGQRDMLSPAIELSLCVEIYKWIPWLWILVVLKPNWGGFVQQTVVSVKLCVIVFKLCFPQHFFILVFHLISRFTRCRTRKLFNQKCGTRVVTGVSPDEPVCEPFPDSWFQGLVTRRVEQDYPHAQ